ncbi:hypothetical protein cypCar_00014215, partial [Cyprinus carpio]
MKRERVCSSLRVDCEGLLMLMGWLGIWALSVLLGSSLWLAYGVRASAGTRTTVKEVQEGLQQFGGAENKVKQSK